MNWKPAPSFPPLEASSDGRIRSGVRAITGYVGKAGYCRTACTILGKRRDLLIHRVVADAFLGPCPESFTVNHKDCDKTNNAPANLEYVSRGDNTRHAWANGRCPAGERHGRHTMPERSARGERVNTAKLTAADVVEARAMRLSGSHLKDVAVRFGISKSQAFNITSGAQWKHIS